MMRIGVEKITRTEVTIIGKRTTVEVMMMRTAVEVTMRWTSWR